jgi:hypothetical protein
LELIDGRAGIGARKSCDYPQISFVIHHRIVKRTGCGGWSCVHMVESGAGLCSASFDKWLSELMSQVFSIIG